MAEAHAHQSQATIHVDQHELNAELANRLSSFYKEKSGSLVKRFYHSITGFLFPPHQHTHIDTTGYQHPKAEEIPQSKHVKRTIYALKKIKEFNHHFFPFEESQIINPLQPGITPLALKTAFAVFNTGVIFYSWLTWSFTRRNVVAFAAIVGIQQVILHLPNFANEGIQNWRRKNLAQAYLDVYGYQFFHEILDPNYDLKKLSHLHNKLEL